jgi:hypothetical protein
MTTASCTVVIEASSREGLLARFASRTRHMTRVQIEKRFADLLKHGYADARRGFDGKWRFILIGKRTRQ